MAKYRIRYKGEQGRKTPSEEVEAGFVKDSGEWIDFLEAGPMGPLVLRVRADVVERIEQVSSG